MHILRVTTATVFTGLVIAAVGVGGCEKRTDITGDDARGMVELLMPQRVELVEAFTQFKSFDGDNVPDGIEVLLHALDSFGDPVKIAGTVRLELYTYNQAAGERAGERICEPWNVTLATRSDQKKYWNIVTGMYEVPLEFPAGLPLEKFGKPGSKFVLEATYTTPLGTHMTDECVLEAPRV